MNNFRQVDRETGFLLPPSVDEWLPERHLARFVVEVIEGLDVSAMVKAYRGSGSASYHPRVLLGLLVYGYATGVFSSRALERASYDSVAFRFIAANDHPDHDTIATFRRRFLAEIEGLFVQVLLLAREAGLLKLGTVALDGTKVQANASRHSALSYEYAGKLEAQLKAEVEELMELAETADTADVPDGMSVPEELARREDRLQCIAEAKAKIEAREEKAKRTGRKPGGRPPRPPTAGPGAKDQVNLTDEDSRIMPVAGGGFEQAYNAQAAVATDSLLMVATDVVQAANDKQQIEPMLEQLRQLPKALGKTETLLADSGYFSQANVTACAEAKIAPLIPQAANATISVGRSGSPSLRRYPRSRQHCRRWCIGWRRPKAGKSMPYASRRRNPCSASSNRCWASGNSTCAASTRSRENGTSSPSPGT